MVKDRAARGEGGRKPNKKRLGGGGLSLEAFAAAKSKPRVNPAQIRQQREFYQNAKKIQKFRKFVRRLGEKKGASEEQRTGYVAAEAASLQEADGGGKVTSRGEKEQGNKRKPKPKSQLEKLREEFERKKKEEEEVEREKEKARQAQREAHEKALRARKDLQAKMRKRTRSGQPVMKYRMEHLLETLQRNS